MNNKSYVPKHLKQDNQGRGNRSKINPIDDENPVDLDWLNKFIDECQKENSIYDKKGDM